MPDWPQSPSSPPLLVLMVALTAGSLAGCVTTDAHHETGSGGTADPVSTTRTDAWQPAPASVRVYPSTRFVLEEGAPILEARIELFDAMGDSVKSSGDVRCELYALVGRDFTQTGSLLYKWRIAMTTLEDQRRYFDPIIRGYVYRLKLDDVELTRRPTLLRVVFQPPGGERLATEARVETDW